MGNFLKSSRCPPFQLIPPKVLQADISSLLSPLWSKDAPPASPLRRSACSCWWAARRSLKHPTGCLVPVSGLWETHRHCLPKQIWGSGPTAGPPPCFFAPPPNQIQPVSFSSFPGGVLTAVHRVSPQRHMPSVSKCYLETLSLGLRLPMATWPTPKAVLSKEILLKNTLPAVLSTLYRLHEVGGSRVGGHFISCGL